jgi:hypothetical protein
MRRFFVNGRWRDSPAPFILFNLVFYLFSNVALATTFQKLSLERLTWEADLIVRGRIQKLSTKEAPDRSDIATRVDVLVTEQWKGSKVTSLVLSHPGGSVGRITQAVPGVPHFSPGEEVILFLQKEGSYFVTVGGMQGKFVIKTDPSTKKEFIEDLTGKSQPLNNFVADLRAILK